MSMWITPHSHSTTLRENIQGIRNISKLYWHPRGPQPKAAAPCSAHCNTTHPFSDSLYILLRWCLIQIGFNPHGRWIPLMPQKQKYKAIQTSVRVLRSPERSPTQVMICCCYVICGALKPRKAHPKKGTYLIMWKTPRIYQHIFWECGKTKQSLIIILSKWSFIFAKMISVRRVEL